ncbi:MAG: type III-A CRISPR-associated protein Csm2 [Thermoplasmatales archaeon]
MENRRSENRSFPQGSETDINKVVEYVDRGAENDGMVDLFRVGGYIEQIVRANRETKPHQLRRFYDYLVGVANRQLALPPGSGMENAIRLQLLRMIPIADYSCNRRLLDRVYRDFISKSAEAVAKKKDQEFARALERFRGAYEALVAFHGKE